MGRDGFPWYRKGRRCWYVYHRGQQVRLHPDKDEAFRLWHELNAGPLDTAPAEDAVGTLIDRYLAEAAPRLKPATLERKTYLLGLFRHDFGRQAAGGVTGADVQAWLSRRSGWGPSTRWLTGRVLLTFFRWAGRPLEGLRLPPPRSRGAETLIDPADHARLLEAAPPFYRDVLTVLRDSGCRPGELLRAEARHLRGDALVLEEHKTDGSGRPRVVFLPAVSLAVVRRLAAFYPSGPLFRNALGRPLTRERLQDWLRATARRLGLSSRVIAYGYRHTLATDSLVAGVPDAIVAQLLGHASTAQLHKHYSHLVSKAQALRGALDRVRGE